MPTYVYELRDGDSVCSTGRLTLDDALERGADVTVAGVTARVLEVLELSGETRILLEPDN